MAQSLQLYDPRTHTFRAIDTADTIDLPFDQVLMVNILIELQVISEYLSLQDRDPPGSDPEEIRQSIVENVP